MRRKILIINFGGDKDIVGSSALISKISSSEGVNTVSLMVMKEYHSSALILDNVEEIITIDRPAISSLFNNKIYPNHYSLNLFLDKVNYVENCNFDLIVNYSGDESASYLTGYFFSTTKICGSHYSSKGNICHTSEWSMLGEIAQEMNYLSFDKSDICAKMMDLKKVESREGYIVRERHEKTVEHSLNKLRALNRHKNKNPKIVGVYIYPEGSQSMPRRLIVDLLREIRRDKGLLPLIITGTSEEDESTAEFINERFNHSLTLVKMDVVAAPSLMKGIDALICTDSYCRDLAFSVKTKVVNISFGGSPFRGGGVVVAPADFKNEKAVGVSDVIGALRYVLDDKKTKELNVSPNVSLYRLSDECELFYEKIDQRKEGRISINRVMARNMIMLRFYSSRGFDKKFNYLLNHNSREDLEQWIRSERRMVGAVVKNILSVIRLVIQTRKERGKIKELAYKFDNLFSYEKNNGPVKIPIIFLRGGIFSIEKTDFVLEELYKTKNHMQKYNALIDDLDSFQRKRQVYRNQKRMAALANG